MDSFYDVPRSAPNPILVEKLKITPLVPEVSLINSSEIPVPGGNSYEPSGTRQHIAVLNTNGENILNGLQNMNRMNNFSGFQNSYPIKGVNRENIQKGLKNLNKVSTNRNSPPVITTSRENINNASNLQNSSELSRKVRFESPTVQQLPSLTYEPFVAMTKNLDTDNKLSNFDVPKYSRMHNEPPCGKTFEEIYMANIPSRHLDLSIIELPNKTNKKTSLNIPPGCTSHEETEFLGNKENETLENKENEQPKTYREFLATQKKLVNSNVEDNHNDSVVDIFNYKRHKIIDIVSIPEQGKSNFNLENYNTRRIFESVVNTDINKTTQNKCVLNFGHEEKVNNSILNKQSQYRIDSCTQNNKLHIPLQNQNVQYPVVSENRGENVQYNVDNSVQNEKIQCKVDKPVQNENVQYKADNSIQSEQFQYGLNQSISKFHQYTQHHFNSSPSNKCDFQTTNTCCQHKEKDEFEPTNRDLLKIIAQQNEQLLLLQKQVALLLNREQNSTKPIEAPPQQFNEVNESFAINNCFRNSIQEKRREKGLSKFSVDVMTSFEVAIRPQHNRQNNVMNCKPKIQEITEVDSITSADKNEKTQSLVLQEPLVVQEMCPSPEPSVNINMNDYSSEEEEESSSEVGETFYHNLMGQVDNILRRAHMKTTENPAVRDKESEQPMKVNKSNKTMHQVREATLKHLRNIGVTIQDIEDSNIDSVQDESQDYTPTEISFAVKQLLMKYLPSDHLAKLSAKQQPPAETNKISPPIMNVRPELSFASVQYMKKYNLIPSTDTNPRLCRFKDKEKPAGNVLNQQIDNKKILDLTALKMQPKLL